MLRPRLAPILFSRQVQPPSICLPSRNGQGGRSCICDLVPEKWLPDLGLAPRSLRTATGGLTGRPATLTPPGNGAAGRIPTCIVPFRRRMPHVFGQDILLLTTAAKIKGPGTFS